MTKKAIYADEMVQVWTTIPDRLRREVEKYAHRECMKPSEFYRRAVVTYAKQILEVK